MIILLSPVWKMMICSSSKQGGGTKKLEAQVLADEILAKTEIIQADDPVVSHRVYRGKNLGTVYTDEQKQAIQNGTFDDIYVGDYWEINGHKWRVMDLDFFYLPPSKGIPDNNFHHAVIMPDSILFIEKAFGDNIHSEYTSGYQATNIYRTDNGKGLNYYTQAFGEDSIKEVRYGRTYVMNSEGKSTGNNIIHGKCISPKIGWVFGGYSIPFLTTYMSYANIVNQPSDFNGQFAAFAQNHSLILSNNNITNSDGIIIRDYVSSELSSLVDGIINIGVNYSTGYGHYYYTGFRPVACIA